MLRPSYSRQFERDLKKMLKQGKKPNKIRTVIQKLTNQELLEVRYRDHKRVGNYKNRRECHIEPNWLLIYKLTDTEITFERTGTHSDLFD